MNGSAYLWERYKKYYCEAGGLGLDISRMNFPDDLFHKLAPNIRRAFGEMDALERGEKVNIDEKRMVGHYWLRDPEKAPKAIEPLIRAMQDDVRAFVDDVHSQRRFKNLLVIGIGGSALGPQFVAGALGTPYDRMKPYFLDNTDPDGMDRVFAALSGELGQTLAVVISKSGGTAETRNAMLEAKAAYEESGLDFARHAVAVTVEDREESKLYRTARDENWLATFPMWAWVGGRTSVTSAVGLLPARLQGIDADALLEGAAEMDEATRRERDPLKNPAMLLALMWHYVGNGRGEKAMVILPYKDRLVLFSKYLQQLVMESLGKELDRTGSVVNQGLTVYGNKGSTDQHAYVQQLREGRNDFFVTFIEVLADRAGPSVPVHEIEIDACDPVPVYSGDYLSGYLQGTCRALAENARESIILTMPRVDATNVGRLIALFERAVGYYASLINVNAYHQPGVEAGKKAALAVLVCQVLAVRHLQTHPGEELSVDDLAAVLQGGADEETVLGIIRQMVDDSEDDMRADIRAGVYRFGTENVAMVLRHLAANGRI